MKREIENVDANKLCKYEDVEETALKPEEANVIGDSIVAESKTDAEAAKGSDLTEKVHAPNLLHDGGPPISDLVCQVADFIYEHIHDRSSHIEVMVFNVEECKFGLLIDKTTNARVSLPISCETVLVGDWFRFESNMKMETHKFYNQLLNACLAKSQKQNYYKVMTYSHLKQVDKFYQITAANGINRKIRATFVSDKLIECMEKRRLGDLSIYCPTAPFDIRISINAEIPVSFELCSNMASNFSRFKDRISYKLDNFQIDLTMVKHQTTQIYYELELEWLNPSLGSCKDEFLEFVNRLLGLSRSLCRDAHKNKLE